MEKFNIYVGFDQKEAIAYHAFCQSLIDKSTIPIQITPLALNNLNLYSEGHTDRSNDFVYSRFLTPFLNNYDGWALFADGDMICQSDIRELFELRDDSKAVMVVKHDYKTKQEKKYLGNINENYPRKNWSSVILWNCNHPKHKVLSPDFVKNQTGKYLHRFSWLDDEEIGELPIEWNWLAIEYEENPNAKIVHYTLGTPCFNDYRDSSMSNLWHSIYKKLNEGME
jgi:lipopolysaccharide biosynthesis glycosyltransferase